MFCIGVNELLFCISFPTQIGNPEVFDLKEYWIPDKNLGPVPVYRGITNKDSSESLPNINTISLIFIRVNP